MNELRLVNADHPLHDDEETLKQQLVWVSEDVQLQHVCARALLSWIRECGAQQEVTLVSGWRSYDQQRQILQQTEAERGAEYTRQFVAAAGCSEHHTGLAIDLGIRGQSQDLICPDFSGPLARKMSRCAAEYGFILRYPQHKTAVTGIAFEPWHFRYVGLPHAQIMAQHDWVLEEYAAWVRTGTPDRPLQVSVDGRRWQIYSLPHIDGSGDPDRTALDEQTDLVCQPLSQAPFAPLSHRAWVELDCANLRHNVITLRRQMRPHQKIMAVCKANAYGHGLRECAQQLLQCGVEGFAVATLEEALTLRQLDAQCEILILGYVPFWQAEEVSRHRLTLTLTDWENAARLNEAGYPIRVHVPIDTGMRRLGARAEDLDKLCRFYQFPHLQVCGTYSHLAQTDSLLPQAQQATRRQIALFFETIAQLRKRGIDPGAIHLQGSYGFLNHPQLPCDWVRFGIALFGCIDPSRTQMKLPLRPVASVHARIAAIKRVRQGEGISYNHLWHADQDTTIAILSIGYADGIPRSASRQHVEVLIRGRRCPLVGAMCMDQCFADLGDLPAEVGEECVVIGNQQKETLSALQLAEKTGTIVPDTLSALRGRLPRLLK